MLTGEVTVLLEESIDIFDGMCKSPKESQVAIITEMIFNLYIPIVQLIKPKPGKHSSLYKRVCMSLYGYRAQTSIEKMP